MEKKYEKPVFRNLGSELDVVNGACASGTGVTVCATGGANANGQCNAGDGVFVYHPGTCAPGSVAAGTCTNGSNAAP